MVYSPLQFGWVRLTVKYQPVETDDRHTIGEIAVNEYTLKRLLGGIANGRDAPLD
jgi:hypothetical protein